MFVSVTQNIKYLELCLGVARNFLNKIFSSLDQQQYKQIPPFPAKQPTMIYEPFFGVCRRTVQPGWENRRSVLLLFYVMESITVRRKSCSQGNGVRESLGMRPIRSGQNIGYKALGPLAALEAWAVINEIEQVVMIFEQQDAKGISQSVPVLPSGRKFFPAPLVGQSPVSSGILFQAAYSKSRRGFPCIV